MDVRSGQPAAASRAPFPRILAAGLSVEFAIWLEQRLGRVVVQACDSLPSALDSLINGDYALLIVDDNLIRRSGVDLFRQIRRVDGFAKLPILYCLESDVPPNLPARLVGDYGLTQLFFHPLDLEEVARSVAMVLGLPRSPSMPSQQSRLDPRALVSAAWEEFVESTVPGLDLLTRTIGALKDGQCDNSLRVLAVAEAHKLAGTIGTAGFNEQAIRAREIEALLRRGADLGQAQIERLGQAFAALSEGLATVVLPSPGGDHGRVGSVGAPDVHVLVVSNDSAFAEELVGEAARGGMHAELAPTIAAARLAVAQNRPDVALLDLSTPLDLAERLRFLSELTTMSPVVPVVVASGNEALVDRVEIARLGGRGFLQKPVPNTQILESVSEALHQVRSTEAKVLTVDDDPYILATLRDLLSRAGVRVTTVSDPLRVVEVLEETTPDLIVFDVDMPHLSGIELCRLVRRDSRWSSLPVVFLTSHRDPDVVTRIFAAGADDYVSKPIVGPELTTRIMNRIERTRLQRSLAETDALTGLVNRHRANQVLDHYLRLATRQGAPLCLAVIDVDGFKQINDRYGHLVGDDVLRRLGVLLGHMFRSDDVVARWGGEEFLVGMYGMSPQHGVRRMTEVLELVRREWFVTEGGIEFQITFSAGLAYFPNQGQTTAELFRAADAALYRAKEGGRNRVLAAESSTPPVSAS
jgi:diguanylate cyclase (GGDEF)-like protein